MAGTAQVVKDLRAIGRLYLEITAGQGLRVQVHEAAGWTTRGRPGTLRPDYVIAHHVAGPDMDGMLMAGRPGIPGPLCNEALHFDGDLVLIASGPANHPGVATVSKFEALGIEASGPRPITARGPDAFPQYEAYACLIAAHYRYYGWPASRCLAHKEIARPDGRKPDPAFGSVFPAPYPDMTRFRALARRIETDEERDWFAMATEADLKRAIREVLNAEAISNNPTGGSLASKIKDIQADVDAIKGPVNVMAERVKAIAEELAEPPPGP